MSWKEQMYEGIAVYLRKQGKDAVEVVNIDEDVSVYGPYGCDTCGPDYETEFNLTIEFIDSIGKRRSYYYNSGFFNLINEIT